MGDYLIDYISIPDLLANNSIITVYRFATDPDPTYCRSTSCTKSWQEKAGL
jgi:hypothetical protein